MVKVIIKTIQRIFCLHIILNGLKKYYHLYYCINNQSIYLILVLVLVGVTNFWENLDVQQQQLRNSFLIAVGKHEFQIACMLLYTRNCALPDGARLSDMKPFEIDESFAYTQKVNGKAYQYISKWMPLVEMASTMFRSKELEMLNKI